MICFGRVFFISILFVVFGCVLVWILVCVVPQNGLKIKGSSYCSDFWDSLSSSKMSYGDRKLSLLFFFKFPICCNFPLNKLSPEMQSKS